MNSLFLTAFKPSLAKRRAIAGITITEFMIGLALSMIVMLFALALFWSTRVTYLTQDHTAKMNETGRFVSQTLTRLIRQTAFVPIGDEDGTPIQLTKANFQHGVHGYDGKFIAETGLENPPLPPLEPPTTACPAGLNFCDSITLRFFGAGIPGSNDGSVTDCVGQPIPAPLAAGGGDPLTAETDRAANHLFLNLSKPDAQGVVEPQLSCRWRSLKEGFVTTAPLATGIEALQFLYGVEVRGGAGLSFLTAEQINAIVTPTSPSWGASVAPSSWLKVVAVRYAFIVRSPRGARTDLDTNVYSLFGTENTPGVYPYNADPGTQIDASTLPAEERTRLRKVFSGVVLLHNEAEGGM
ncbi:MAG: PilW family protein [Burkholderiaceae bacterium]|nr:PilW family protein [Burkholderiaceae bacterium]